MPRKPLSEEAKIELKKLSEFEFLEEGSYMRSRPKKAWFVYDVYPEEVNLRGKIFPVFEEDTFPADPRYYVGYWGKALGAFFVEPSYDGCSCCELWFFKAMDLSLELLEVLVEGMEADKVEKVFFPTPAGQVVIEGWISDLKDKISKLDKS